MKLYLHHYNESNIHSFDAGVSREICGPGAQVHIRVLSGNNRNYPLNL